MPIEALDRTSLPGLRVRGRNVIALVLAPEFPISAWFAALDRQISNVPGFFADRPVVVDLAAILEGAPESALVILEGLESRDLRLVGVEGVDPVRLEATPWRRLASILNGRDISLEGRAQSRRRDLATPAPSLLIDGPVRSGQSVVFEAGDVTVVGAVASGAEVIAGGSIHIYGALRGRALAGLKSGAEARIFCRALEAEMIGIDRLYRTAEHWGPPLHGRPAQVRCDRDALKLSPLV